MLNCPYLEQISIWYMVEIVAGFHYGDKNDEINVSNILSNKTIKHENFEKNDK